jgi:hypothetical protein
VLIAPDGQVLSVHSGFRSDERALLEAQVSQALSRLPAPAGSPPKTP